VRADEGQATSIAAGIASAASADGWLIALADMPAIPPGVARMVADALRTGAMTAAPTYNGQRGHPVGFAAALRDELLALVGDTGARSILARHPPLPIAINDGGVLYDVDAPRDTV